MVETKSLTAPLWLIEQVRQAKAKTDPLKYGAVNAQLKRFGLETVCDGARCPNRNHCWSQGTATFMILGNTCTRKCTFCAVEHGRPTEVDLDESRRLKEAVHNLGLTHVVITSVTRDDLPDGGADHFASVIKELHDLTVPPTVEVLVPDFKGSSDALEVVLQSEPEVFAHNIETIPRLYPEVRPGASYKRSLGLLALAVKKARPDTVIKTGFMLGLGETEQEVVALLKDLRIAGVEMVTIGQYLSPSAYHYPVKHYVTPDEFGNWKAIAKSMGFKAVASDPLVRSSYQAGTLFSKVRISG